MQQTEGYKNNEMIIFIALLAYESLFKPVNAYEN